MTALLRAGIHNLSLRPMAGRFARAALASAGLAGALAVAGSGLLALLVGGLGIVPLSAMAFLMLLPAGAEGPDGGEDGRHGPTDGPPGPKHDDGPDDGVDWARFQREFWAHVERERQPAAV